MFPVAIAVPLGVPTVAVVRSPPGATGVAPAVGELTPGSTPGNVAAVAVPVTGGAIGVSVTGGAIGVSVTGGAIPVRVAGGGVVGVAVAPLTGSP